MPLLVRELQMEIGGCRITLWQQEGQQIWWTIKDVLRLLWNAESDALRDRWRDSRLFGELCCRCLKHWFISHFFLILKDQPPLEALFL